MSIIIEQTQYVVIPTGEYTARIAEIEHSEGLFGEQVKFTFMILGGEYDGQTLLGWCSAKYSAASKLYKWSKAAFNAAIPKEYSFNSDDLLNRRVALTVVVQEKENGEGEFNKIESVRPYRGQESRAKAPAPPPMPEDEIPF